MTAVHQTRISTLKSQMHLCADVMSDAQAQPKTQFEHVLGNVLLGISPAAHQSLHSGAPD